MATVRVAYSIVQVDSQLEFGLRVGSWLTLFCIQQLNQLNSHNDLVVMTAASTLSWISLAVIASSTVPSSYVANSDVVRTYTEQSLTISSARLLLFRPKLTPLSVAHNLLLKLMLRLTPSSRQDRQLAPPADDEQYYCASCRDKSFDIVREL